MKRTPIKRKPKDPELWRKQYHSHERCEWLRSFGCVVPHCYGQPVHTHHVKTKGAGGTWRELVPLCATHHDEVHRGRETFERRHGVDLTAHAAKFVSWWSDDPHARELAF